MEESANITIKMVQIIENKASRFGGAVTLRDCEQISISNSGAYNNTSQL